MTSRRIFAAVDLSDEVRSEVGRYAGGLREEFSDVRVRWERPEKYHITLRFEAKADGAILADMDRQIQKAAAEYIPFELAIEGTGVFVNRRGPTVLWLGIGGDGNQWLARMAGIISGDRIRKFHPHLTICRIKDVRKAAELIEKHRNSRFPPVNFIVREVVLYESTLTPNGSIYEPIARYRLEG